MMTRKSTFQIATQQGEMIGLAVSRGTEAVLGGVAGCILGITKGLLRPTVDAIRDAANRPEEPEKAKPEKAKPEKAKPEKAKPEKAKPEKAKPEKAGQEQPQAAATTL